MLNGLFDNGHIQPISNGLLDDGHIQLFLMIYLTIDILSIFIPTT